MVKMSALYELLADLNGLQVEAFMTMADELRDVGALPRVRGRRGANVSDATVASTLLLAALPVAAPWQADRTFDIYGSLIPEERGGIGAHIPVLKDAASRSQFDEALAVLVGRAGELKTDLLQLLRYDHPRVPDEGLFEAGRMTLELSVVVPLPSARLVLWSQQDGVIFEANWKMDPERAAAGFYRDEISQSGADRQARSNITHRSLFAIAELLGQQAEEVTTRAA